MSTQNPDVAKSDTPPLLLKLQAQIDDDKDFAWAVKNVGGCRPMTWEFGILSPSNAGTAPPPTIMATPRCRIWAAYQLLLG